MCECVNVWILISENPFLNMIVHIFASLNFVPSKMTSQLFDSFFFFFFINLMFEIVTILPEKCRFCLGTGNVTVELGGDEKEVSRCINCDGAGSLTCTTCQGSGIQPRYLDRRYGHGVMQSNCFPLYNLLKWTSLFSMHTLKMLSISTHFYFIFTLNQHSFWNKIRLVHHVSKRLKQNGSIILRNIKLLHHISFFNKSLRVACVGISCRKITNHFVVCTQKIKITNHYWQ